MTLSSFFVYKQQISMGKEGFLSL